MTDIPTIEKRTSGHGKRSSAAKGSATAKSPPRARKSDASVTKPDAPIADGSVRRTPPKAVSGSAKRTRTRSNNARHNNQRGRKEAVGPVNGVATALAAAGGLAIGALAIWFGRAQIETASETLVTQAREKFVQGKAKLAQRKHMGSRAFEEESLPARQAREPDLRL